MNGGALAARSPSLVARPVRVRGGPSPRIVVISGDTPESPGARYGTARPAVVSRRSGGVRRRPGQDGRASWARGTGPAGPATSSTASSGHDLQAGSSADPAEQRVVERAGQDPPDAGDEPHRAVRLPGGGGQGGRTGGGQEACRARRRSPRAAPGRSAARRRPPRPPAARRASTPCDWSQSTQRQASSPCSRHAARDTPDGASADTTTTLPVAASAAIVGGTPPIPRAAPASPPPIRLRIRRAAPAWSGQPTMAIVPPGRSPASATGVRSRSRSAAASIASKAGVERAQHPGRQPPQRRRRRPPLDEPPGGDHQPGGVVGEACQGIGRLGRHHRRIPLRGPGHPPQPLDRMHGLTVPPRALTSAA